MTSHRKAILTMMLVLLWNNGAYAHDVPFFFVPVFGALILFPFAFLSSLLGWLGKNLYFADRANHKILSASGWSDALKEAALMYVCYIFATFVVDVVSMFILGSSIADRRFGRVVALAAMACLSALATRSLQRRYLNVVQEDSDCQSSAIDWPLSVFLLGLIAPAIFSLVAFLFIK